MSSSCFLLLFLLTFANFCMGLNLPPKPYIVYMGGPADTSGYNAEIYSEYFHLQMLSSVIPREESGRISIGQSYHHAFRGFSAMLTDEEASALSRHNEVVSVFPDTIFQLHTTRSWDFLGMESHKNNKWSQYYKNTSSDVIIGVIDTGIWPESPSFNDEGIGEIPTRWKGVCMEGFAFTKSSCNRKLIGARFYSNLQEIDGGKGVNGKSKGSPRDTVGHGTHTASIAAGATVGNANYFGLANGTARGGLPSARIAVYKACSDLGCSSSVIFKAIDDAIKDGVDVISISIGLNSGFLSDILHDTIAIGAFHAMQRGVTVVCSAGNDGPDLRTVTNTAPWIFTVAASTIDRKFESTVLLGNGMSFKGVAISFSLSAHPTSFPLVFGENVAADPSIASDARNCGPGTLNAEKVAGKIIVCMNDDPAISRSIKKLVVADAGAKGLILIDEQERSSPFDSGSYPFAEVGKDFGSQILKYINSTKLPIATISPAKEVQNINQAPLVAEFSSRGPSLLTEDILKPDIMAPGVAILAATVPDLTLTSTTKPSFFSIRSGTSMACPHVAGAVAFIKSVHPEWSSSMIKSAIMTTASISNNNGNPLTNTSNFQANPHEMGAGEINPLEALDPGLVFETRNNDYLDFLCFYGYKERAIRAMSKTSFECPTNGSGKLIPNINFPSISIGKLYHLEGITTVKRVATNVGPRNAAYVSSVVAPKGLNVKVSPERIAFSEGRKKASFEVSFDGRKASKGYNFGAIIWSDGSHIVRLVFAVNIE